MPKKSPQLDSTAAKERVSFDKLRSLLSLIFGARARQFDALLARAPTSGELTAIAEKLKKPSIKSVIFDVDGTLVPPYAPIPPEVTEKLRGYLVEGREAIVYTNSPHSDRLDTFREAGVEIAETGKGKPSLEGFRTLCLQHGIDPASTAMIGNFAVTDMPLVPDGEAPLFPLNILVKSIPPQKKSVGSLAKDLRARVFHILNVLTAKIVTMRNKNLLREI